MYDLHTVTIHSDVQDLEDQSCDAINDALKRRIYRCSGSSIGMSDAESLLRLYTASSSIPL